MIQAHIEKQLLEDACNDAASRAERQAEMVNIPNSVVERALEECIQRFSDVSFNECLIYQAMVTRHDYNKDESYIGLTDNTFKTPYNGHTNGFQNETYRNATALSNYIWTLKDKKISYSLK